MPLMVMVAMVRNVVFEGAGVLHLYLYFPALYYFEIFH